MPRCAQIRDISASSAATLRPIVCLEMDVLAAVARGALFPGMYGEALPNMDALMIDFRENEVQQYSRCVVPGDDMLHSWALKTMGLDASRNSDNFFFKDGNFCTRSVAIRGKQHSRARLNQARAYSAGDRGVFHFSCNPLVIRFDPVRFMSVLKRQVSILVQVAREEGIGMSPISIWSWICHVLGKELTLAHPGLPTLLAQFGIVLADSMYYFASRKMRSLYGFWVAPPRNFGGVVIEPRLPRRQPVRRRRPNRLPGADDAAILRSPAAARRRLGGSPLSEGRGSPLRAGPVERPILNPFEARLERAWSGHMRSPGSRSDGTDRLLSDWSQLLDDAIAFANEPLYQEEV
jgi:hypothetical protein